MAQQRGHKPPEGTTAVVADGSHYVWSGAVWYRSGATTPTLTCNSFVMRGSRYVPVVRSDHAAAEISEALSHMRVAASWPYDVVKCIEILPCHLYAARAIYLMNSGYNLGVIWVQLAGDLGTTSGSTA